MLVLDTETWRWTKLQSSPMFGGLSIAIRLIGRIVHSNGGNNEEKSCFSSRQALGSYSIDNSQALNKGKREKFTKLKLKLIYLTPLMVGC